MTKGDCLEVQALWNEAVDEYISLGKDKRSKEVIERAAKIGQSNGALYRVCEGVACNNFEGCGGTKLRLCSRCKIVSILLIIIIISDCFISSLCIVARRASHRRGELIEQSVVP
jgi:hypothetical protein